METNKIERWIDDIDDVEKFLDELTIHNNKSFGYSPTIQEFIETFNIVKNTNKKSKELNRNFVGIELDKQYFDIAESRING